jgi:two-component system, chemotaxis family, CheB/CheR fusion protein
LIPGDIGRPLGDLKMGIDYAELIADAGRVLQTLVPSDREVAACDGRWYLARLLPYRTLEDHIGGVVLTFVDITERRRNEEELRARNEELVRFNRAAVGRELRMVELKKEINALLARVGERPRYTVESEAAEGEE